MELMKPIIEEINGRLASLISTIEMEEEKEA